MPRFFSSIRHSMIARWAFPSSQRNVRKLARPRGRLSVRRLESAQIRRSYFSQSTNKQALPHPLDEPWLVRGSGLVRDLVNRADGLHSLVNDGKAVGEVLAAVHEPGPLR